MAFKKGFMQSDFLCRFAERLDRLLIYCIVGLLNARLWPGKSGIQQSDN